jgi:hypothetical protein
LRDGNLFIERGDLLFVGHRSRVATSPSRLFVEERVASVETVVFKRLIHIDLTFALRGGGSPRAPYIACAPAR